MTNKPIALENTVAPIELPAMSMATYTLIDVYEERVTEDGEIRVTEDDEVRIVDGFDFTVNPPVNVVEIGSIVAPIEVE